MSRKKIGSYTFRNNNNDSARPLIIEALSRIDESPDYLPNVTGFSDLSLRAARQLADCWIGIDPELRAKIVHGMVGDAHSLDRNYDRALLAALQIEPDLSIRFDILNGLSESGDLFLLDYLLESAGDESSARNRIVAVQLLGNFALMAEYGELNRVRSNKLIALLNTIHATDSDFSVRLEALVSLAYISDVSAIWNLIEEMYETDDDDYLLAAARAMGRQADDRWIDHVSKLLAHEDSDIRYEAITAAGSIQSDRFVQSLIEAADDEYDQDISIRAIESLGQIKSAEAILYLRAASHAGTPPLQEAAVKALEEHEQVKN